MQFKKYDLNQAQDGDRVMVKEYHAPVISRVGTTFVGSEGVVVRWPSGVLTLFDKDEDHFLIHKPVYLLEDKPIYVGDTVYCGRMSVRVEQDHATDSPPEVLDPTTWSFAPLTKNINGFLVPYPETEAPEVGTTYWAADPNMSVDLARKLTWEGDCADLEYLHEGRVHLNAENAQIHTNALLSFFKVKD